MTEDQITERFTRPVRATVQEGNTTRWMQPEDHARAVRDWIASLDLKDVRLLMIRWQELVNQRDQARYFQKVAEDRARWDSERFSKERLEWQAIAQQVCPHRWVEYRTGESMDVRRWRRCEDCRRTESLGRAGAQWRGD